MKHLIFNWIIRRYWGEKLAARVMKFVLNQDNKIPYFITEVETETGPKGDIYKVSVYCLCPNRDHNKPIFKFRYSIYE